MVALTLVAMGSAIAQPGPPPEFTKGSPAALPGGGPPPNIVILLTDDQAEGTMDAMPYTRSLIGGKGVTLRNGIIPTSQCCPSRAALLSGQYARTTDVYENVGRDGGWPTFNESGAEAHTLPVALQQAGYRTGLFGKYLNGFALADASYVPPGWDRFRAIYDPNSGPRLAAGAYYDYILQGTGADEVHGTAPEDYSTDVVAGLSVNFIKHTPADQPLFLYYSTSGPHPPFTPAPRHVGDWHRENLNASATQLTLFRPDFMPDNLVDYDKTQHDLRRQHEALLSVDEGIRDIVRALGDRASNTLFVFLSDNGLQFGEHGLKDKNVPYSGSTDVPMMLRWDGVLTANSSYSGMMTNADLTATMADAAGVTLTDPDGVSFFAAKRPSGVILEAKSDDIHPAYCGIRTKRYVYIEYSDNTGRELFDYKRDPNELVNVASDDAYSAVRASLRAQTREGCAPVPPGFSWH
jgi:arylsulfatase A-like enzyme